MANQVWRTTSVRRVLAQVKGLHVVGTRTVDTSKRSIEFRRHSNLTELGCILLIVQVYQTAPLLAMVHDLVIGGFPVVGLLRSSLGARLVVANKYEADARTRDTKVNTTRIRHKA